MADQHTSSSVMSLFGSMSLSADSTSAPRVVEKLTDTVAEDAEGVDLSRLGRISLVQLSTPTSTFLVDVLDKGPDDKLVGWLRTLLEDESVTKVIHDCRMDSDALYHHLKISLVNAHDTSCWHAANGFVDKNLNETLQFHRLSPNVVRDGSVYKTNPAFWATRPLTQKMISWAAGDVQCMFDLYKCQVNAATDRISTTAKRDSEVFLSWRSADVDIVNVANPGRFTRIYTGTNTFIGSRGANIRSLQRATDTIIYNSAGRNNFMVFYRSEEGFAAVKRAAR